MMTGGSPTQETSIYIPGFFNLFIWLVGQGHPSEKYEFVNWDD